MTSLFAHKIVRYGLVFTLVLVAGLAVVAATGHVRGALAQGEGPKVTVYNSNIAMVSESRQIDLKEGINNVSITDVPSGILPETVRFRSLSDPEATVLEQNYEYDLVGSDKLLQKYIDQDIKVITQDGETHEGKLLSSAGDVVLEDASGAIDAFKLDQIRSYSFPALPEGLITRPTLVWTVDATETGLQDTEIAYLTNGLNWKADYVLLLAEDNKSLDLDGWVTLNNQSGATYTDAQLKLVAGDINRLPQEMVKSDMMFEAAPAAMATPAFEQRTFSEYHLYELAQPVTIKDLQTKQVQFLTTSGVPSVPAYVYDASQPAIFGSGPIFDPGYGNTGNTNVRLTVTFNTGADGVDAQLPAGSIRMYQNDIDGSPLLIGEDAINHTPKGEDVTLTIGNVFDLVGERTQTDYKQISDKVVEETYTVEIRNQKENDDVTVRVVEHLSRGGNWEIVKASPDTWKKTDSNTIEWSLPVPAQDKATITYTVRYTW